MKKRTYDLLLWIGGLLLAAAFIYYFVIAMLLGGWRLFSPKIKLSKQEKQMVKQLESKCSCDVQLQHNYDLIKRQKYNNFRSTASALNISFTSDLNRTMLPCGYGDSLLKNHATQVVNKMLRTISYKSHYNCINVFYYAYQYGAMQSTCSKTVRVKLDKQKNIESVKLDRY